MPMTLELPDEVAEWLQKVATGRGISVQEYALERLSFPKPAVPGLTDGASLVAYWEANGLLGTRTDITDTSAEATRLRAISNNGTR